MVSLLLSGVGIFIELGNALYNEGVGIPITKYQGTERSYCIQLWATTGIKNIKLKCTRTVDRKIL